MMVNKARSCYFILCFKQLCVVIPNVNMHDFIVYIMKPNDIHIIYIYIQYKDNVKPTIAMSHSNSQVCFYHNQRSYA